MDSPAEQQTDAGLSKPVRIVLAVLLLVLTIVTVALLVYLDRHASKDLNHLAKTSTRQSGAAPLEGHKPIVFVKPGNLNGYIAGDLAVNGVEDYKTESGKCELQFGVLSAGQLPGSDLADIVGSQLDGYRKSGATVQDPEAGPALELKQSGGSVLFSMPTLVFSLQKGDVRVKSYYSAAILQNGNRAYVTRVCSGSQPINDADLQAVNNTAKQITIKVE